MNTVPAPSPTDSDARRQSFADVRRVVGWYVVVSALWIGLSDSVVALLLADPEQRVLAGLVKGWGFVGVTAVLLYGLMARGVERLHRAFDRERTVWQHHQQSQALLQALADGSPDAIFAKDREGRYQLVNRAAARLAGLEVDRVIGLDDTAVFPADQAAMLRANDQQVMQQDRPETFEEVLDTAQGRMTFLATKGPLRDAHGQVTGLFGISRDITERSELAQQRQAALAEARQARDVLRDVLARVDDGFVALDQDWRYTYLNQQAARLLGREHPDDLIGRNIWTEFPEGIGQPFHLAYEQAMRTQQPVVLEEHFKPWDRWFENRIYPSPQGLSIYFTDITARKSAERALQVSELRYRLAARQGQVWDWNAETGELVVATEFWEGLGQAAPPPECSLQHLESYLHPDDLPRFRHALTAHLSQRVPYGLEFRLLRADGAWRWFRTHGQAVWDAQGRATYMAGTTFDITERRRAEEALRESEAYRRLVFEQLADGVLLIDRTLRILDANPQALAMLGYAHDELLRLSLPDLLADQERARLDSEMLRLPAGGTHLDEWEHRRRDGTQFPAEVSMRSLDAQRHVQVLRDITVRRASEKAVLTYQMELAELTRRLLEQEKETTQRVAQSLHDQVGQTLAVIRLHLEVAVASFGASMPDGLNLACDRIAQMLDQAVREVRQVLADLRPPLLEEQGLAAAIDNEIRSWVLPGVATDNGADVLVEAGDDVVARRWPADVEYGFFMVAREAIANARQHAGASLIRVLLSAPTGHGGLDLRVIDDGRGIPAPMLHGRPGHLGIVGMRERAIAIGARFAVVHASDGGTEVSLRWEGRAP
ncbi:MAG: hypothetical protein RL260_91 [Pseudomonadota bacterium]